MTPRAIAAALDAAPIEGLTYTLGTARPDAEPGVDAVVIGDEDAHGAGSE